MEAVPSGFVLTITLHSYFVLVLPPNKVLFLFGPLLGRGLTSESGWKAASWLQGVAQTEVLGPGQGPGPARRASTWKHPGPGPHPHPHAGQLVDVSQGAPIFMTSFASSSRQWLCRKSQSPDASS